MAARPSFVGSIEQPMSLVAEPLGGKARRATHRSSSRITGRPLEMPMMRPAGSVVQPSAGPAITMSPLSG